MAGSPPVRAWLSARTPTPSSWWSTSERRSAWQDAGAVAELGQDPGGPGPVLGPRDLEIKGVGEPIDDVEQPRDVDRLLDRFVAHPGGAHRIDVGGADLGGGERQLLEERQHGAEPLVDRGGPIVGEHRLDLLRIAPDLL